MEPEKEGPGVGGIHISDLLEDTIGSSSKRR